MAAGNSIDEGTKRRSETVRQVMTLESKVLRLRDSLWETEIPSKENIIGIFLTISWD